MKTTPFKGRSRVHCWLAVLIFVALLLNGFHAVAMGQSADEVWQKAQDTKRQAEEAKKKAEQDQKNAKTADEKAAAEKKIKAAQKAVELATQALRELELRDQEGDEPKVRELARQSAMHIIDEAKRLLENPPASGQTRKDLKGKLGVTDDTVTAWLDDLNERAGGSDTGVPSERMLEWIVAKILKSLGKLDDLELRAWLTRKVRDLFIDEGKLRGAQQKTEKDKERVQDPKREGNRQSDR